MVQYPQGTHYLGQAGYIGTSAASYRHHPAVNRNVVVNSVPHQLELPHLKNKLHSCA